MSFQKKNTDQTRIIAPQEEGHCLDVVQLEAMERNFRDWAEKSSRPDIRLSRKRILLVFLLIRYTGAKLNEILSIDPFLDIDFDRNSVVVEGRHGKGETATREVPIPQSLAEEIESFLADSEFAESVRGKFAVDPGFVRRKFYDRAAACGFDKKLGSPELIRRARAVELLQGNMPLPAVQNLLGHSSSGLTESLVAFSEPEMKRLAQLHMDKETDRKTSARNSFFGKVRNIVHGGIFSIVEMSTLDGFSVHAAITKGSFSQLGLDKGRLISAEVKAPTVTLQKAGGTEPLCSAENMFKGLVSRVEQGGIVTECVVRISDVTELCAIITTDSYQMLGLKRGDEAWVLFNSFAVVLHAQ